MKLTKKDTTQNKMLRTGMPPKVETIKLRQSNERSDYFQSPDRLKQQITGSSPLAGNSF